MDSHLRCCFLFLALLGLVLGCSGSDRPETAPVSGSVTLDGSPVAGAQVTFISKQGGVRNATGTTDSQGKYQLTTFEENDGAVLGEHSVTVTKAAPMEHADEMDAEDPSEFYGEAMEAAARGEELGGESEIPAKYADPETSGLTFTVTSGENTFDIPLTK